MSDHEPMLPVSADAPCPACGKPDWCLIRDDGKKGICSRVQSPHKAGDAGWFHVYEDEPLPPKANGRRKAKSAKTAAPTPATSAPPVERPHKAGKNKLPPSHWQADVERFAARVTPEHLATIAGTLGVPPSALSSFPLVGFCSVVNMLPTFSCPETDAGGKVVGYVERFPKGNGREVQGKYLEKITPTGSDRGLTIPAGLAERSGPLFCVEAFSDTVAMTAAGLACVGRPFNSGGAEMLAEFLRDAPAGRPIVIVGEHDRKPDGRWPGKEGMEVIAAHLTRELKRPILTALPPDGAKDVRAWLTDPARGETPWAERGAELSAKLMAVATPSDTVAGGKKWTAEETGRAFAQAAAGQAEAREAEKDPPPLALLVQRARERFELFRSADGIAFASADKVTALPVEGIAFRDQLYRLHEQRVNVNGKDPATPHLMSSAVAILAATARTSDTLPVIMRSGLYDGTAYIHRADPEAMGEVVAVDASGRRTVPTPPVRFAFGQSAGTLPPAAAGDIDELREFLNLDDPDQFPLVAAWVGAAVLSAWPTPILMLAGQQGTAKSTTAKVLMRLIDPAAGDDPLRGRPKDEETLAVAARNAHLLAFDNLSGMDNDLADLLCRVATGGVFSARKKYTDADENRITIRKVVILTGIDLPSLRGDLLERMLTVRLRPIPDADRVTEEEFFKRFDAARPRILAGLYSLIARGLAPDPDLAGMRLPRMADFAKFAALAVGREAVESRLAAVAQDNAAASLDAYPWVPPFDSMMQVRDYWSGTPAELLAKLEEYHRDEGNNRRGDLPKKWPGAPHVLSGQLDRLAPALRAILGLEVEKRRVHGGKRTRQIIIRRTDRWPTTGEVSQVDEPERPTTNRNVDQLEF